MATQIDLIVLGLGGLLAFLYLFRESLFGGASKDTGSKLANGSALANGDATSGDFISKLKAQNKRIAIFYGSQTGTAEEYATKLAKEAKARFGTSSLVLDPEDYEFEKLDQMPEDCVAVFVMATYGEGEPTDNAVGLVEFLENETPEFTNGDRLENLNYIVFGLGNRTYEHFNAVARKLDQRLQDLGAKRIGERGEGDDDKSMEEDYLAWKDGMFDALASTLHFEEGGGGDVADFKVTEVADHPDDKVYKGELSARALLGTKGIHDAKNPYNAVISTARELFTEGVADRTCVHVEFDIDGSGISYQHGDHIAVWAHNPEREVERVLAVFGLTQKRQMVIDVESLDPTLAKVPFPTPTTFEAVFRHYLDISSHASRQTLNSFAKFAPTPEIQAKLEKICADKDTFQAEIGRRCLKTAEAMQYVAGDSLEGDDFRSTRAWNIPFDRVISELPRVGPRFYSISSSPKMHPKSVHITAVVLRYKANDSSPWVHGLATNFISSIKMEKNAEQASGPTDPRFGTPKYLLTGPRDVYTKDGAFRAPIHIRRSNFRLPTSPKIPVIMVGPGTGVAPFRSFVQDRVCSAQKAVEKSNGASPAEALKDWGNMWLFYGCRRADEDFLYRDEWPEYADKLGGKFIMDTSLSREKFKPDGSKLYVQDLIWERRKQIAEDILERKAYIYICGEAKGMAQDVEAVFTKILEDAKGSAEEAKKEIKLLKERSRLLLDVWS
ncbi:putative NADPH-cytochrome P450 reductase [Testicularia cyperi]|uniref:NADPH--cytochrome P450 reductase n=1 Tax=Testicularia cyperi TaxID=1882483 RepID=A0A317XNQ3_9BASI|nr:putative NADPH-cytochrome P450 reductase [Testicularia cyperi]